MKLLSPTQEKRLNEVLGFLLLALGLVMLLSLVSYHTQDPSWDTAAEAQPLNLIGYPGSYASDLLFQAFGATAFLFPLLLFLLAWKWIRSEALEGGLAKLVGAVMLTMSASAALAFLPWRIFGGAIRLGGTAGFLLARYLLGALNLAGAIVAILTAIVVSVYLVSTFTLATAAEWTAGPRSWLHRRAAAWRAWRDAAHARALEKARERERMRRETKQLKARKSRTVAAEPDSDTPPWEDAGQPDANLAPAEQEPAEPEYAAEEEIPICPMEDLPPVPPPVPLPVAAADPHAEPGFHAVFALPSTELLNEIPGRSAYDEQELKDTAVKIKSKFEEFNVLGNVVQINPGPVVTTFEFKPDAGIKYSRITNLTEDLCLGLQAESILIERIPGKPTVGIEVPNTKRELIALRQMLESEEFAQSASRLTIPLGKDINGRIRMAALESMPHLLIAGSTGAGKSVMINSMIMSILYKSTPSEVRMIMERRLRLLAEYGVRNIDQFNKKVRKLQEQPRNLFADAEAESASEDLRPLPYILILIDELADLMMLEGKNVEESVTRLAQMARAVGMHLVLATQRPSVDVITGLIKANFPSRISFRVATRVDSRTVLDVMGAEHLLGKGDMLFLPPGSSRLTRVHGAFVTETEICRVVDFWKAQAAPEYDQSFLIAPPADDEEAAAEGDAAAADQDPMYEEAVRLVLQMGKASTSTLQRHLRLGYGRAARILDMMQRDGIIGPPDGSKPREVLKRPDWLREVENQVR